MTQTLKNEKWQRIQIVCTQPFAKRAIGLKSIRITTEKEEDTPTTKERKTKKIRLRDEDSSQSQEDEFDQRMNQMWKKPKIEVPKKAEITQEQKERMERNRLAALELKKKKMEQMELQKATTVVC
eukprot:TRINITY_DN3221_c0_g1_i1.p1 TRINITY_DN3221_c0_g1~~TRINITY_DN3221_c0_g1_i1.p1  ORF type:complete len:125 (+),score=42.83 TRINITY_DN3221_c0_g1_i1:389-763(+)